MLTDFRLRGRLNVRRAPECAAPLAMADAEQIETLKAIVGEGIDDTILKALLLRAGGDVAAAANSFFDGGATSLNSMDGVGLGVDFGGSEPTSGGIGGGAASHCAVGEDVLGTLFKTLEDQGRKLAGEARESARSPARVRGRASFHGAEQIAPRVSQLLPTT